MSYYHDLVTEKSWLALQELKRKYKFVLVGGWAVYLYTKGLKSHDIDFICDYKELEKLKNEYELIKNERLKKYEIHKGDFDIDIYVPFFSDLGLPMEDLQNMAWSKEGFDVLKPEALLILKQKAYSDRKHSLKGEKDKLDIISLTAKMEDLSKYHELLLKYGLRGYKETLHDLFSKTRSAPELNINEYAFSKLRKKLFNV